MVTIVLFLVVLQFEALPNGPFRSIREIDAGIDEVARARNLSPERLVEELLSPDSDLGRWYEKAMTGYIEAHSLEKATFVRKRFHVLRLLVESHPTRARALIEYDIAGPFDVPIDPKSKGIPRSGPYVQFVPIRPIHSAFLNLEEDLSPEAMSLRRLGRMRIAEFVDPKSGYRQPAGFVHSMWTGTLVGAELVTLSFFPDFDGLPVEFWDRWYRETLLHSAPRKATHLRLSEGQLPPGLKRSSHFFLGVETIPRSIGKIEGKGVTAEDEGVFPQNYRTLSPVDGTTYESFFQRPDNMAVLLGLPALRKDYLNGGREQHLQIIRKVREFFKSRPIDELRTLQTQLYSTLFTRRFVFGPSYPKGWKTYLGECIGLIEDWIHRGVEIPSGAIQFLLDLAMIDRAHEFYDMEPTVSLMDGVLNLQAVELDLRQNSPGFKRYSFPDWRVFGKGLNFGPLSERARTLLLRPIFNENNRKNIESFLESELLGIARAHKGLDGRGYAALRLLADLKIEPEALQRTVADVVKTLSKNPIRLGVEDKDPAIPSEAYEILARVYGVVQRRPTRQLLLAIEWLLDRRDLDPVAKDTLADVLGSPEVGPFVESMVLISSNHSPCRQILRKRRDLKTPTEDPR